MTTVGDSYAETRDRVRVSVDRQKTVTMVRVKMEDLTVKMPAEDLIEGLEYFRSNIPKLEMFIDDDQYGMLNGILEAIEDEVHEELRV